MKEKHFQTTDWYACRARRGYKVETDCCENITVYLNYCSAWDWDFCRQKYRCGNVASQRRGEEPVTLAQTESGIAEDYAGLPAAEDIPRIETAQEWEELWQTKCVTIEPIGIIATGIGERHPWLGMYTSSSSRWGGSRKREDVTKVTFDFLGEYAQYYLLQLPDQQVKL